MSRDNKASCSIAAEYGRLVTTREAAELFGMRLDTLAVWRVEHRGPPYIKLNSRTIRYRAADLLAYLEAMRMQTEKRPLRAPGAEPTCILAPGATE